MSLIEAIKESWGWVEIKPEEVVYENEFGNLIIRDTQGLFWRLCPEDVYCEVVAKNQSDLDALFNDQEFLADWHTVSWVEAAKEKLGPLPVGRKYHFAIPGILGGEYGISNFCTVSHIEQIHYSGDIGRQIKDLPDGAKIKLSTVD